MSKLGNFLASGPVASAPSPATAPQPAAPYKSPVSDGSSQMPMVGDRQRIPKPPTQQVASTRQVRENNDRTSGMSSAMGAMADKMHPVRRK